MYSRLGWLVSPVAVFLLLREPDWLHARGALAVLRAVRIEQWMAMVQLLLHVWFLWRACRPEPAPAPVAGGEPISGDGGA